MVYVDDMVITRDDENEIIRLKKKLSEKFELMGLGKLRYFLDMEFVRSKESFVMNQRKYTIYLIKKKLINSRPLSHGGKS